MFFRSRGQKNRTSGRRTRLLAAFLILSASVLAEAQSAAKVHVITIEAMQFSPANIEVRKGDAVIWKNKDAFPHNATSSTSGFASGDIQSGRSWKWTANKSGVFPYTCTLHPGMKATLVVK